MNLYVGTSGFCYKEWWGSFYPPEMAEKEMLPFYASHFRSVEINNTFYRMPRPGVLENWASEVPPGFRFVLKVPQRITHFQRLKNVGDSLDYLLATAGVLKERLGPLLFQLPPNLKKDAGRLREVFSLLPAENRAAIEFRHESWFDDETYQILREHNAALCIAEAEDDLSVPHIATADWGYLRLRRQDYRPRDVGKWAKWVLEQGWQDAFIFFKHEEAGQGPRLAQAFLKLASTATSPRAVRAASAGSRAKARPGSQEQEQPKDVRGRERISTRSRRRAGRPRPHP